MVAPEPGSPRSETIQSADSRRSSADSLWGPSGVCLRESKLRSQSTVWFQLAKFSSAPWSPTSWSMFRRSTKALSPRAGVHSRRRRVRTRLRARANPLDPGGRSRAPDQTEFRCGHHRWAPAPGSERARCCDRDAVTGTAHQRWSSRTRPADGRVPCSTLFARARGRALRA